MSKYIMAEITHLPIRNLLIKLAEELPKEKRYYMALEYIREEGAQFIVADNLAEAYVLFYDYKNLTSLDKTRNAYTPMQDVYNESSSYFEDEIDIEWLNQFNFTDPSYFIEVDDLPVVITKNGNEILKEDSEQSVGEFVKSACKK